MGSNGATFGDTGFVRKSPVADDEILYRRGRRDGVKRTRDGLRLVVLAR
jgi:hypothetical protein